MAFKTTVPRWSLLPIRLVVGFGFLSHGLAKLGRGSEKFGKLLNLIGAPFPLPTAWMVTTVEIVGGVALLCGALLALSLFGPSALSIDGWRGRRSEAP